MTLAWLKCPSSRFFSGRMHICVMFCLFLFLLLLPPPSCGQSNEHHNLTAQIIVPYPHSLVRGDVPVYGLANGKDFKEYILEYGAGKNPAEWTLIKRSDQPEETKDPIATVSFDLVKTIPGNLGMWVTGLSEYEYGHYDVDLPVGDYVLRLRVKNLTGEEAESRVSVQVGRVALNCCPNSIKSLDGRAVLNIPEHSLLEAVKVFSLTPLTQIPRGLQEEKELRPVGALYRLQPAGETFSQKSLLKIFYDQLQVTSLENIGIGVYNPATRKWDILASTLNRREGSLEAEIESIPQGFAVYGILESATIKNQDEGSGKELVREAATPLLCNNDFEQGMGQWRNKHGSKGARLEIVQEGCPVGHCLKISNLPGGGNFAARGYAQPFNVRQYPWIDFDYRIPASVKINLLVKVDGRWFDVVLTDDEKVYWDINMEKAGVLDGVNPDGKWHHIRFNLFDMLKRYTDSSTVEELVLADWDSTGFKRLEFGKTPIGESYYLDNFRISSAQYFWQVGWNDRSAREFSDASLQNTGAVYSVGQPFSVFPDRLDSATKIKFDVPSGIPQVPYRLTVKWLDALELSQESATGLIYNQKPVDSRYRLYAGTRIDFILGNLKPGDNILEFSNAGQVRRLDCIALAPIGDIPFAVEAMSDPDDREYIFAGEENGPLLGMRPLSSYKQEKLTIVFTIAQTPEDLLVELTPVKTPAAGSWLDLRQVQVFSNNDLVGKISLGGGTEESLKIVIPAQYLQKGINRLGLASVTADEPLLLQKIAIIPNTVTDHPDEE